MKNMTELVKKYQNTDEFPRMIGSGGGMDYLIVAKDEAKGLQLGIKTLIGGGVVEGKSSILIGFRLRSARIPGSNVASIGDEAKEMSLPHEGWSFPWESVGASNTGDRASLVRTLALARTSAEANWVFDDLDHVRFFGKVQAFLLEHVDASQLVVTTDDITNYIKASIYPVLLNMQAQSGDPVKQLEMLELQWDTMVKDHAAAKESYETKKADLLAKIAEMEAGEAPTYHPKAHFAEDELIPMDGVANAMLSGAKPKLSAVQTGDIDNLEGEGSDEEPDMSAESDPFGTSETGPMPDGEEAPGEQSAN